MNAYLPLHSKQAGLNFPSLFFVVVMIKMLKYKMFNWRKRILLI